MDGQRQILLPAMRAPPCMYYDENTMFDTLLVTKDTLLVTNGTVHDFPLPDSTATIKSEAKFWNSSLRNFDFDLICSQLKR